MSGGCGESGESAAVAPYLEQGFVAVAARIRKVSDLTFHLVRE